MLVGHKKIGEHHVTNNYEGLAIHGRPIEAAFIHERKQKQFFSLIFVAAAVAVV